MTCGQLLSIMIIVCDMHYGKLIFCINRSVIESSNQAAGGVGFKTKTTGDPDSDRHIVLISFKGNCKRYKQVGAFTKVSSKKVSFHC